MYIPTQFEESRVKVMHELIQTRPLATLITLSTGGINANHIPLHLSTEHGSFGILRGHVARANAIYSDLVDGVEALAVFHGPESYISPSWYATKREHGKVVPTWNYVVVHAHGSLRIIDEPSWLRAHLEALTARQEASFPEPWALSDAPHEFTERVVEAIVGIEIVITKLVGKWKVSQNQPAQNQAGIIGGLRESGGRKDMEMAALVEAASREAR
jgi:transcriptional regulator